MIINGIKFESLHFKCSECGAVDKINYRYVDSNKSLQARCECGKWIGNVKYDKRTHDEIRKDKIKEWLKNGESTKGKRLHGNCQ